MIVIPAQLKVEGGRFLKVNISKLKAAADAAFDLDTLVRDQIPRDIYDMITADDVKNYPLVVIEPNANWNNDDIQFSRLIAEAEANGAFTHKILVCMSESMDLTIQQLGEIVERAQKKWDKIKYNT